VVDADGAMPVQYTGILPDLFRDNQSVIATGHMAGDHFVATEVLAKHDETYMPKELKDAMEKAHRGGKAVAASGAPQ
jgi:cytochrome c-type biogenesis protein CcmE